MSEIHDVNYNYSKGIFEIDLSNGCTGPHFEVYRVNLMPCKVVDFYARTSPSQPDYVGRGGNFAMIGYEKCTHRNLRFYTA